MLPPLDALYLLALLVDSKLMSKRAETEKSSD